MTFDIITASILGIVEGLTEFVPVVIPTGQPAAGAALLRFCPMRIFGKTFAVLIQFGGDPGAAVDYFGRLWKLLTDFSPTPRRGGFGCSACCWSFLLLLSAGRPLRALSHDFNQGRLFQIGMADLFHIMLILSRCALWIACLDLKPPLLQPTRPSRCRLFHDRLMQCVADIPAYRGPARPLSSPMLLGGRRRRSSSDFSFWLAMRPWLALFALRTSTSRTANDVGKPICSRWVLRCSLFVCAWIVSDVPLLFQRHGFSLFACGWRVVGRRAAG